MTVQQIKQAIKQGNKVYWHHSGYEVIKDSIGQYLIKCHMNEYYTSLTDSKGNLIGKPDEYYTINSNKC